MKNDLSEMYENKVGLLTKQLSDLEDKVAAVEGTVEYAQQTTTCSPEQVSSSEQFHSNKNGYSAHICAWRNGHEFSFCFCELV